MPDDFLLRVVQPGETYLNLWPGYRIAVLDTRLPWPAGLDLKLYEHDADLMALLDRHVIQDHELGILYTDDRYTGVLIPGEYVYWKGLLNRNVQIYDRKIVQLPEVMLKLDLRKPELSQHVQVHTIADQEIGLLMVDGAYQTTLKPGAYHYWKGPDEIMINRVDMRTQMLDMTGQELMTADKVTLRLNVI